MHLSYKEFAERFNIEKENANLPVRKAYEELGLNPDDFGYNLGWEVDYSYSQFCHIVELNKGRTLLRLEQDENFLEFRTLRGSIGRDQLIRTVKKGGEQITEAEAKHQGCFAYIESFDNWLRRINGKHLFGHFWVAHSAQDRLKGKGLNRHLIQSEDPKTYSPCLENLRKLEHVAFPDEIIPKDICYEGEDYKIGRVYISEDFNAYLIYLGTGFAPWFVTLGKHLHPEISSGCPEIREIVCTKQSTFYGRDKTEEWRPQGFINYSGECNVHPKTGGKLFGNKRETIDERHMDYIGDIN